MLLAWLAFGFGGNLAAQVGVPAGQKDRDRKAVVYLFNRLTETFCRTPEQKLLMAWPGLPVPALEEVDSREFQWVLSEHVDVVPLDDLLYKKGAQGIPELIRYVLDHKQSAKGSASPEEDAAINQAFDALFDSETGAPTPKFEAYLREYAIYTHLMDEIRDEGVRGRVATKLRVGDAPAKVWAEAKTKEFLARAAAAMDAFKRNGNYDEIQKHFKLIDEMKEKSVSLWWDRFRTQFDRQRTTSSSGDYFHLTQYYPPPERWLKDAHSRWIKFAVEDTQVDLLGKQELALAEGKVPDVPLITFAGVERMKIGSYSILMEIKRVVVERPWLDRGLFRNRAWTLPGVTSDESGLTVYKDKKADMPSLISGILLAKNITVTPDGFQSTTAAAMALSSKSFGMVNLKGTYLFGKGLAEAKFKFDKHFNPALNKETHRVRLTIPGAQIIGFITDEVPKSPNPDPKYSFDK